ncbi:MAG: permease [Candidatus Zixiibacteriota bacterium]|nr:MAG: permease [candidate division Zixibacteria bacterium]
MDFKSEWKPFTAIIAVFLLFYFLPVESGRVQNSILEAFYLTGWYAREHVILCLIPAFFIAGAIAVFIRRDSVIRYLGARANKILSYGVASVSGSVLAVCSCTVLPIFAGIYRMGAGIGPATAFLYAGPAINVLAIILTMRILGMELGIARAVGAVFFSIVIGLLMHLFFIKNESEKKRTDMALPESDVNRPLSQNVVYFALMIGILVFANWGKPEQMTGIWNFVYENKWIITGLFAVLFGVILIVWLKLNRWQVLVAGIITIVLAFIFPQWPLLPFSAAVLGLSIITAGRKDEAGDWFAETWGFAKQIMPLLFGGVLVAGLLLGRPGYEGLIPSHWISDSVGGNSLGANLFASVAGAFMYFATLTEVPILQGLMGSGMGKGPALALLLAGPALSLPNMLVIRSVMGTKKTIVFVMLVIIMATISGLIFGSF